MSEFKVVQTGRPDTLRLPDIKEGDVLYIGPAPDKAPKGVDDNTPDAPSGKEAASDSCSAMLEMMAKASQAEVEYISCQKKASTGAE